MIDGLKMFDLLIGYFAVLIISEFFINYYKAQKKWKKEKN